MKTEMLRSMKFAFRALTLLFAETLVPVGAFSQGKELPAERHIIICIDGVGISTINKMREEGRFKLFRSPSHMISPFPSLTNAALGQIRIRVEDLQRLLAAPVPQARSALRRLRVRVTITYETMDYGAVNWGFQVAGQSGSATRNAIPRTVPPGASPSTRPGRW